ncbi:Uma2 family endonuclease [Kamptonema formosum]|uniref:Uma2 family endonuclease n=1 Tax=Kamptonema formosum TaxID=331992 RepID=UPI00034575EB|nr:Uma2 family endonuclease [Oscillatoria sp. PCC 10802]
MSVQLLRRLFTVREYRQMVEAGILTKDDRVELIKGEIVKMSPIGRRHAACVKRLIRLFSQRLGERAIVGAQDPVELSEESQPQPDLTLLQPREDFYESGHPKPGDIFLIVEVADTVEADRLVKIPLYAEAVIPEVWLVDINEGCVEVHRHPSGEGYGEVLKCRRGESAVVGAFADVSFTVDEVLG